MTTSWRTIIRNAQAWTRQVATVTAIQDFNRRKRLEQLAEQLGTFDDVVSREELLRLRSELRLHPR